MKTIQTLILMILIPFCVSAKSDSVVISQLEKKIENVEKQNETQENTLNELISKVDSASSTLEFYQHKIDSLKENLATTNATTTKLGTDISDAKSQALKDKDELSKNIDNKTMIGLIGIILLLLILVSVYLLLKKRIKTSSSSIASIKQTQQKIKETQKQLQEENVKLDAKLVEILEKQIESRKAINITSKEESNEIDHSLVLKIADEIAKIENNLAKMDKEIKGYKNLQRAIDRIKNNLKAKGYEIVDLIGTEYNEGMPFEARFVPDENIEEGKRIITGITKLQVNYNGKMIQAASIVVSQNI